MEIEIDYKGKKEIVVLKTLSWGENNDCVRAGIKGKDVDFVLQQEHRLVKSIAKAPFEVTMETLRELPANIGDKLFNAMQKLNQLEEDVAKNLNSPSEAKEPLMEKK